MYVANDVAKRKAAAIVGATYRQSLMLSAEEHVTTNMENNTMTNTTTDRQNQPKSFVSVYLIRKRCVANDDSVTAIATYRNRRTTFDASTRVGGMLCSDTLTSCL
jgi:hypothetical protein